MAAFLSRPPRHKLSFLDIMLQTRSRLIFPHVTIQNSYPYYSYPYLKRECARHIPRSFKYIFLLHSSRSLGFLLNAVAKFTKQLAKIIIKPVGIYDRLCFL